MNIVTKSIKEIIPYENNPRKNDKSVNAVANSIQQFGFKVPIIIDKENTIVAGHTRYKAAVKLKLQELPCIIADDLSDEQIKAFRIADNKVGELSQWDFDLLAGELDDITNIDMSEFGSFGVEIPDFDDFAQNKNINQKKESSNICTCPKCGFEWVK